MIWHIPGVALTPRAAQPKTLKLKMWTDRTPAPLHAARLRDSEQVWLTPPTAPAPAQFAEPHAA